MPSKNNIHLVTGYAGEEHIESNDDRSFNAAYYGEGEFVMQRGSKFTASIISNNKVRVLDGDILMQGAHIRKPENTYVEVNIENGAQGYMRNDLIGVTYEKDQTTGVEGSNMVVIKGAPYVGEQGDPSHDPVYTHGNILMGDTFNFMPLYRAELDSLTLKKLTPLFEEVGTFESSMLKFQEEFAIMMSDSEAAVADMIEQAKEEVEEAIDDGFGSIIHVTTEEASLIGKTVTASKGTETKTAVISAAGTAKLRVPWTGVITLTAENDEGEVAESKVSAPYFGEYSEELGFYKLYGFIDHMAIKNPSDGIEGIEANANYKNAGMKYGEGVFDYGSWEGWDWLRENLPYMVGFNGVADYQLNPTDYTKKADGSQSDITNQSYQGGAYSWIPKIYKKEYISGTDRYVYFCRKKLDDDFKPVGFVDFNDKELDGVWLPMFYGSVVGNKIRSIAGTSVMNGMTTAKEYGYIQAAGARHVFLGGSIVNTLNDILVMIGGSRDIQTVFGAGFNTGESGAGSLKANTVIGGGQFFGTSDNGSLNKLFHSIVYGSYQQYQRDPYTILSGGTCKVSPHYKYDLNGNGYVNTGKTYGTSSGWQYPDKMRVVPDFGVIPESFGGSTSLGYTDGFYANASGVRVAIRFGDCLDGLTDGVFCLNLSNEASNADWYIGASDLLLPPVGEAE